MPRLMSVAFTEQAVVERRKTVTRRDGWKFLKPGDRLTLCRKVMGRQGAPLVRLAEVEVVDVRRQPLDVLVNQPDYGEVEMIREGFPGMDPAAFIDRYFVDAQGLRASARVTRIEWRYLDDDVSPEAKAEIDADTRHERTADARDRYEERGTQ